MSSSHFSLTVSNQLQVLNVTPFIFRTPVTVISAGVKSILDIGLTLEYLETQGVCVAAYGGSRNV